MIDRGPADAVRSRLADPRDVARRLGFDRIDRQRGDGVLVCCPAHAERTPSCSLTRSGGTLRAKCFSCGWSGDVFTLIASVRGLDMKTDFPAIVAEGSSLASIPLPSLSPAPSLPTPITDDLFAVIVARLLGLCPLRYSPDVCVYLDGRGIADEAARDGWGALRGMSEQRRVCSRLVAEFGRQAMVASGFCAQDDEGWVSISRPASRLLIPWRDAGGRIVGLQRRRIAAGEPRYVATAGRPLREPYGLERLAQSPRAAVAWVEGAVDALALRVESVSGLDKGEPSASCRISHRWATRAVGIGAPSGLCGKPQHERNDVVHAPSIPRIDSLIQAKGARSISHRTPFAPLSAGPDSARVMTPETFRDGVTCAVGTPAQGLTSANHPTTVAYENHSARGGTVQRLIALALPGVEGWRSAWAAYTRGRDVYVATDADDAGDRVAVTIDRDCRAAGARSVQRMRSPAKDWCAVLEERRKV